jgi:hypothetical protein
MNQEYETAIDVLRLLKENKKAPTNKKKQLSLMSRVHYSNGLSRPLDKIIENEQLDGSVESNVGSANSNEYSSDEKFKRC